MPNLPSTALGKAAKQSKSGPPFGINECQMQAHNLYGIPTDGTPTAAAWWVKSKYRHSTSDPSTAPAGALHYFVGGSSGAGHVMISRGGSLSWSTDIKRPGYYDQTTVEEVLSRWTSLHYVGWTEDIDGVRFLNVKEAPVTTTFGFDVAHYQAGLSISSAQKQGYEYVTIKCTQGTGYADPLYPAFRAAAEKAGMLTAAYHFLEHGNAAAQAANLARHIIDKSLPVVIDIERSTTTPTMKDWVDFRNAATALGLNVTQKYISESYWDSIGRPTLVGPLALWTAAYPSSRHDYGSKLYPGNNDSRWHVYGGQMPVLWQFASTGMLDGYGGNVDMSAFRGTRAELAKTGLFKDYGAKPVPPKPPLPEGVSTVLQLVKVDVLDHRTSDHNGMLWRFELSSGHRFSRIHWNIQGTDPDVDTEAMVDYALTRAGVASFNECETIGVQNHIAAKEGWSCYLPGAVLSADGKQVISQSDEAWNAIAWDDNIWEFAGNDHEHYQLVHGGVKHITPVRGVPRIALRYKATGEIVWFEVAHAVHHIEEGGNARVHGQLPGQNDRAKLYFAELGKDVVYATRVPVGPNGETAPLAGAGDLNVDYLADQRQVLAGKGTSWFPYSVLGPVASIKNMNRHAGTHGARLIDWGWYRQAH